MTDKKHIRIIADYGHLGDLAFAEVVDTIEHKLDEAGLGNSKIYLSCVPAFDTYATGFVLAQLANNSKLGRRGLSYVNTAPRKDNKSARINNAGEGLVYARLENGHEIVAVNSGYSLTLVKPWAAEIRAIDVSNEGTQFRSRDNFPDPLVAIAGGNYDSLREDVRDTVPDDLPPNRAVYTDGYGNIKCNIDPAELERHRGLTVQFNIEGSKAQVPINVGAKMFDVNDGEFIVFKGSSGWALPDGSRRIFTEIAKRGGNAAEAFDKPLGGAEIKWRAPRKSRTAQPG